MTKKSSREAEQMATLEAVISEGRTVVFNLLAAIEQYEQSQQEQGSDK